MARNDKAFSRKTPTVMDVVSDVKSFGFLWFKNRFKRGTVDWDKWCKFDIM